MERALRECVVDGETEVDVEELVEVSLYFYVPPVVRISWRWKSGKAS